MALDEDAAPSLARRPVRVLLADEIEMDRVEVGREERRRVLDVEVEASRPVGLDVEIVREFRAFLEAELGLVVAPVVLHSGPVRSAPFFLSFILSRSRPTGPSGAEDTRAKEQLTSRFERRRKFRDDVRRRCRG